MSKPKGTNKFHLHIQIKYRANTTPTKKDKINKALKKYKNADKEIY